MWARKQIEQTWRDKRCIACFSAAALVGCASSAGVDPAVVVVPPPEIAVADEELEPLSSLEPQSTLTATMTGTPVPALRQPLPTLDAPKRPTVAPVPKSKKRVAIAAYKRGRKLFKTQHYVGALRAFREADRTVPGAAPKHRIAVCLDKLGRRKQAIAAYERFIQSNPSTKYARRVRDATKRVAVLRRGP